MFTDKKFSEVKKEIFEFNNLLQRFMITSSQLNASEENINLYATYDMNLRVLTKNILECEKTEKKYDKCINEFKDAFYKLRSETSINLEKHVKRI